MSDVTTGDAALASGAPNPALPNPAALELAVLLCHASRIERALLREVRLGVAPHLGADAEGDLWNSGLAETRGLDGLTLRSSVLESLRATAARWIVEGGRDAGRLAQARTIVARRHAASPDLVQLEELLTWEALQPAAPDADQRLRPVLSSLTQQHRVGIARWAARALPRLPRSVQATSTATTLAQVAGGLVGRPVVMAGGATPSIGALAPVAALLEAVLLGVRRVGDLLELGLGARDGWAIEVPLSEPRLLEVVGSAMEPSTVAVPAQSLVTVVIGWAPGVAIRDATGTTWAVPEPGPFASVLRGAMAPFEPGVPAITVGDGLVAIATDGTVQVVPSRTEAVPIGLATSVGPGQLIDGITSRSGSAGVTGVVEASVDDLTVSARVRSPAVTSDLVGAPMAIDGLLVGLIIAAQDAGDGWRNVRVRSPRVALTEAIERRRSSTASVRLLPAGHGTAVLVSWGSPDGDHHLLFDTGPRTRARAIADLVAEYTSGRLDLMIASHQDDQATGGVDRILNDRRIDVAQTWINNVGAAGWPVTSSSPVEAPSGGADEPAPLVVDDDGPLPRHELPGGAVLTLLGPTRRAFERAVSANVRSDRPNAAPTDGPDGLEEMS